jgi:glucokinase
MTAARQPDSTAIGVDLGGTHFRVGWLGSGYELRDVQIYKTHGHRSAEEVLPEIVRGIDAAREAAQTKGHTAAAVGIGVPAVIDPQLGTILVAPNLSASWQQFPIAATLSGLIGLPVHLLNDARSFTFAESRAGAARGVENALGITVGTGVGGGLVLNGQLRFGPHWLAGEFGHLTCDTRGPQCACGSLGCVEVYASGTAIAAAASDALKQGRAPRLRAILFNNMAELDARAVATAALAGDTECLKIFERAGEALGVGIANVMKVVDIERVVVGGGVASAVELLFGPMQAAILRHSSVFRGRTPGLVAAQLKHAGATGAAIWAHEHIGGHRNE